MRNPISVLRDWVALRRRRQARAMLNMQDLRVLRLDPHVRVGVAAHFPPERRNAHWDALWAPRLAANLERRQVRRDATDTTEIFLKPQAD